MVVASGTNAFSKEMAIRKRIASIYNKRAEDFTSLREYNDYLEEVEDMIVNLTEGVDAPAIEMRIAQYQRENAEQIMNAQARKAEEYAAALAASRGQLVQMGVDVVKLINSFSFDEVVHRSHSTNSYESTFAETASCKLIT